MSTLKKRFNLNWMFECPDAVLTCSTLKCGEKSYIVFGGHDKTLYLMDENLSILDSITFDGWVRTTHAVDITNDGCEEILVGAGDGNFLVVKLVKGIDKLAGIMNYKSKGKVLSVIAGDFTRDKNIELIYGSEDKTLKIFENIDSTEPKFTLYYDSWVTACTLDYLKLPDVDTPIYGLLAGTKNGMLQLIEFKEDKPDIVWQKELGSQINTIEVGDVSNDGYHEIVIGTDDSLVKIFNSSGEELKTIKIEESRPISLKIIDIDDDNAKEIIVGCADGTLNIYHNPKLDSLDIDLKWKASASNSIKMVSSIVNPEDGKINILFGGYDRSIRCISDLECGETPPLEVPNNIAIPETQTTGAEETVGKAIVFETVPTNIREYIFKYLIDNRIIEGIGTELEKRGYLTDSVVEEFQRMISEKVDSYEKITYSVWTLPEDQVGEGGTTGAPTEAPVKKGKKIKPVVIEQEVPTQKGGTLINALKMDVKKEKGDSKKSVAGTAAEVNIKTIIIAHLEKFKLVSTKTKLVEDLVILGYDKDVVEKQIDKLRMEGVLLYSRSEPKGWSLGTH
ncbi:MAG: WD40 repeat domain-containing protein [Candidatus Lokiarchaeota archaeon]|nr:WD40 repeat domain-containing protein [Candidatus Lokiarchaeota archaeon]